MIKNQFVHFWQCLQNYNQKNIELQPYFHLIILMVQKILVNLILFYFFVNLKVHYLEQKDLPTDYALRKFYQNHNRCENFELFHQFLNEETLHMLR